MTPRRPSVVLYNPRAVFHTMPLALMALASALDRARIDVVIVDGRLERDPLARVLEATRDALCLGVSVLTGAPIRDALAVSRAVKAHRPGCRVVWGGWHPSLFPRDCVEEPSVDVAVVGQGEDTFAEIVTRLAAGDPLENCAGTVVRRDGGPVTAPTRPLRDLNEFPPLDYSLIPVERYFALKRRRQVDYISSQGCRFRCAFCADPAVYARGWTGLDPERVVSEAARLRSQYGMEELAFQDETFFTHPARVDRMADGLLRRNVGIAWTATLRADQACRMGEALFAKAVRAGLRRVMIGVESGSQATLDWLEKDLQLDQVSVAADLCVRHDVGAIFNFIVGFPGEPDDSIDASLQLAKRLRSLHPQFETPIFYYRPYPGNPIADRARQAGYEFPRGLQGWADFDYVAGRGPWVSATRFRQVERFKFYTRHAWQPGRWRWPLRRAARWRCERDWYAFPVEKAVVEWMRRPEQVS
ncbi:MAG: B12-binding domain-containing radical SAM protein [Acidobacteriota bacterium]